MKSNLFRRAWQLILVASIAICSASCSDKESGTQKLPDCVDIICEVGDTPTLTFTVNENWRLASSATWCKFQSAKGLLQDTSGHAGTNTVTLEIGDQDIEEKPTYASITIIVGGKRAIIAEVERGANNPYIKLYDASQKNVPYAQLGYNVHNMVYIKSNFRYALVEHPDWIDILNGGISGTPGQTTESGLMIINDGEREKWPIDEKTAEENSYELVFSDESGEKIFRFPIIYKGMGKDELRWECVVSNNPVWEVTPDGKSFSQPNEEGGVRTIENSLEYNIIAQQNKYEVVYVEKIIERGIPSFKVYTSDKSWMHFDKSDMSLTVDATNTLRYGHILTLPVDVYDEIKNNLNDKLFGSDNSAGIELPIINSEYFKYIIADIIQRGTVEADSETQMDIYHSITALDIPAMAYDDAAVMAQYGVEEAYTAPFVNSIEGYNPGIVINPRIEGWNTEGYDDGVVSADVWYKGEKLQMKEDEKYFIYYIGENVDELLALYLNGPKAGFDINGENIYIVFKVNGEAKKLLVVTPPTK